MVNSAMKMTKAMQKLEREHGKPIKQVLRDYYAQLGSQTDVAKALGIHQSTLSDWLIRLDLVQHTVLQER